MKSTMIILLWICLLSAFSFFNSCRESESKTVENQDHKTADSFPQTGNFQLKFSSGAEPIEAGKPASLAFTPVNLSSPGTAIPLDAVHEKKIHLILVSGDLSWFDHIHPAYQTDGSYTVTDSFPHGGNYNLFAVYKPAGGKEQLEKINISVSGNSVPAEVFTSLKIYAKSGDFSIQLKPDDGKFISGKPIHFDGVFTRNGKVYAANSLQNYLGAKGHMVAIQTGTKEFLHIHPEVEGTILHFHATFAKAGMYRAWLQFMADEKLHTVDFTIRVENGTEPVSESTEKHDHDHDHNHDHPGHKH